ncbi:replication protein A 70 kDa DNA-binding subunit B-like [Oryza sativa Japonica Group]|uniref:replication protein A 70 kDa DNA-binding subunit B-like n=1 Tax=Oryza sativa subsp. japonica TaxID=39947 RepID=UPI000E1BF78B|nr:uncharacterized protein LOC112936652 [Oryza sativa Japonica Group]
MAHVLISQLSFGDSNKRILARVSRLWNFTDLNDDTKIFHTDLVLLDEMGTSIHAQIYPPITEKMKPLLKEEKVYYIDSFTVRAANRTYRLVANNLMILFSKWTTLEEHINVPPHFPGITFSLTPFEDVPSLVEKKSFYVDIMGVITEVGAVTTIRPKSRNAKSLKRTLQIRDASNSTLPVTLWGERATSFDADDIYNAGQTQAQVAVFVGTLVKDYRGLALAQTFNQSSGLMSLLQDTTRMYQKKRGTRFIVNVTVRRICNEYSWWYNSCRICYKTSKPYGSSYRYSSCSSIGITDPRYKVVLIASDDDANATFILFGRIAQRLLRRPVESLIEEKPPNSEYIPSEITSLIGSNFAWNGTQDTPTSKSSSSAPTKKSIVVSVSHMQSSKTKPKTDDKPKTDTKAKENTSHDKSSIVVLPDTAENKGKGLPETAEEAKQATPSFPTDTLAKKRGRPTPTATPPVAKKLFKDDAQQKGNDSE